MLQRQRRLQFLSGNAIASHYVRHLQTSPTSPVVSLIFCLFSKYFPSEFAIPILLLIQYISHSLGGITSKFVNSLIIALLSVKSCGLPIFLLIE